MNTILKSIGCVGFRMASYTQLTHTQAHKTLFVELLLVMGCISSSRSMGQHSSGSSASSGTNAAASKHTAPAVAILGVNDEVHSTPLSR